MKRTIAIILTSLMLFSTVAIAQAQQSVTSTPPTTIISPTDTLDALIANETNATIKAQLQNIRVNRQEIVTLRVTSTAKVNALKLLIANMPVDDENEALEKARDIVESFDDRVKSGIEHDQKIARQIENLRNHVARIRQNVSEQNQNNSNGERKRSRIRNGKPDDDGDRKNGEDTQHMRQNRRSDRNEEKILRRVERVIKSQERIIGRLERRIEKIDDLIEELTP